MDAPTTNKPIIRDKVSLRNIILSIVVIIILASIFALGVAYFKAKNKENIQRKDPLKVNNQSSNYVSKLPNDNEDIVASIRDAAQRNLNNTQGKQVTTPPIIDSSDNKVPAIEASNVPIAHNSDTSVTTNSIPPIVSPVGVSASNEMQQKLERSRRSPLTPEGGGNESQQNPPITPSKAETHASKNNEPESRQDFMKSAANSGGYIETKRLTPKSPHILYAGTLIPATLAQGLNSDLSHGVITAVVRRDVYDSISHKKILIPWESKLVGMYDSNVNYGQTRVMVAWTKLYYPDGSWVDLKAQPGTDMEGFTGFSDQVDNKYWKIFGSSFIIGTITGLMQMSQNNTNANVQAGGIGIATNTNPTAAQTLSGSLGQQMGQTGLAITQKNLNIAPTLTIRRGYQFQIQLSAALVLPSRAEKDTQ